MNLEEEVKLRMMTRVVKACIVIGRETESILSEYKENSKDSYYYYKALGLVYEDKKDYKNALEQYNKAFKLKNNTRKHIIRVQLLSGVQPENVEELNDKWDNFLFKGIIQYKKYEYDTALDHINTAYYKFVELHGQDHPLLDVILIYLVEVLECKNSYTPVLVLIKRIHNKYRRLISRARLEMKELNLESALQIVSELNTTEAHLIIVECYIKLKRYEDCINILNTTDPMNNILLSEAYLEKGDADESLKKLNEINKEAKVYNLYIRIFIKTKQYVKAFDFIDKLINIRDNAAAEVALGHIHNALYNSELPKTSLDCWLYERNDFLTLRWYKELINNKSMKEAMFTLQERLKISYIIHN
jgi:tetratricopeptide (TPR) repeat protein